MSESVLTQPMSVEKRRFKSGSWFAYQKVLQGIQFISDSAGSIRQSGRILGA